MSNFYPLRVQKKLTTSSRHISELTKLIRKRCKKIGINWTPWILATEFSSLGTRSVLIDWITGRSVHCMSQAEKYVYMVLRWNSNVDFICEQARLDIRKTNQIAKELCLKPVANGKKSMTVDFLVVMKNGKMIAVSVKSDRSILTGEDRHSVRAREKLCIEKRFFESQGIPWILIFKDNINKNMVHNIMLVTEYYDASRVTDRTSYIKHLIATKQLRVDMKSGILNFRKIRKELFHE